MSLQREVFDPIAVEKRTLASVSCRIGPRGFGCHLCLVLANDVRRYIGIKLANRGEGHVAHRGVTKLGGKNAKAGCAGWVVVARDHLGEDFAAESGKIGRIAAAIGARHALPADHVESTYWDAMAFAEGVETCVFVEEAGQ